MPHWSRANGWAIWAVSEVLKAVPDNHPAYKQLKAHFKKHVDGLIRLQDASGFWFNVLDEPASKQETSGTAIFTMAIARGINQGWLGREEYERYAIRGWKALNSVIDSDGTVHGICMGTMCSEDLQYYLDRPILDDDSHGILGLIFAAIEMQKLLYPIKP
jgi:rhamnogalacturonyl hydrolase YesR